MVLIRFPYPQSVICNVLCTQSPLLPNKDFLDLSLMQPHVSGVDDMGLEQAVVIHSFQEAFVLKESEASNETHPLVVFDLSELLAPG